MATLRAVRNADTKWWTTADLNLWDGVREGRQEVGLIQEEKKILVTGRKFGGRAEVVRNGKVRWVTSATSQRRSPSRRSPPTVPAAT